MFKVWAIVQNEYITAVRTKAFILGLILLPVFMLGGLVVQYFAKDKVDIRPRRFAVVDPQGGSSFSARLRCSLLTDPLRDMLVARA